MSQHSVEVVEAEALLVAQQLVEGDGRVTIVRDLQVACGLVAHDVIVAFLGESTNEVVREVGAQLQLRNESKLCKRAAGDSVAIESRVVKFTLLHGVESTDVGTQVIVVIDLVPLFVELVATVGFVAVDGVDRSNASLEVERVGRIAVAGRLRSRVVYTRERDVATDGEPLIDVVREVAATRKTLERGVAFVALFAQVADRHKALHLVRIQASAKGVLAAIAGAEERLLPVHVVTPEEAVDFGIQLAVGGYDGRVGVPALVWVVCHGDLAGLRVLFVDGFQTSIGVIAEVAIDVIRCQFTGQVVAAAIGVFLLVEPLLPAHGVVVHCTDLLIVGLSATGGTLIHGEGKLGLTVACAHAALGGDEDHTVTGARAVEGGRCGVFEDADALDVCRCNVAQGAVIDGSVHYVERCGRGVDGAKTTDAEGAGFTRLTGGGGHLYAGGGTAQGTRDVRDGAFLQVLR